MLRLARHVRSNLSIDCKINVLKRSSRTLYRNPGSVNLPVSLRAFSSGDVAIENTDSHIRWQGIATESADGESTKFDGILSPEVISSMVNEIIYGYEGGQNSKKDNRNNNSTRKKLMDGGQRAPSSSVTGSEAGVDHRTLDMLMDEAVKVGRISTPVIESVIEFYLGDSIDDHSSHRRTIHVAEHAVATSQQRNVLAAAGIVLKCSQAPDINLSPQLCHRVLQGLVHNCNWYSACSVLEYMISSSSSSSSMDLSKELFFTVGGMMQTADGVEKVLSLMALIARHRRGDLATLFSYNKVNRFSLSMGSSNSGHYSSHPTAGGGNYSNKDESYRENNIATAVPSVSATAVQEVCDALLQQMHPPISADAAASPAAAVAAGWFSFSLAKMLVAIACASNHHALAATFVRQAVGSLNQQQQQQQQPGQYLASSSSTSSSSSSGTRAGDLQLLSLLRSFSQGDGVAQRRSYYHKHMHTDYSAVTVALLDLLWAAETSNNPSNTMPHNNINNNSNNNNNINNSNNNNNNELLAMRLAREHGPMPCSDLFNCYWVLAHRARNVAMDMPHAARDTPIEVLHAVDASTERWYNALRDFWENKEVNYREFRPPAGFERRVFRILCDEFDYRHKVVEVNNTTTNQSSWEHIESYEYIVKVWKKPTSQAGDYLISLEPPSLSELLRRDATLDPDHRKFDGEPLYWAQARRALQQMEPEKLAVVAHRLVNAMGSNYASPSWALLVMEQLRNHAGSGSGFYAGTAFHASMTHRQHQERERGRESDSTNQHKQAGKEASRKAAGGSAAAGREESEYNIGAVPLPLGILRSAMKMCAARNDLYGLLEVLHYCYSEQELARQSVPVASTASTTPYQRLLRRLRTQPKYTASATMSPLAGGSSSGGAEDWEAASSSSSSSSLSIAEMLFGGGDAAGGGGGGGASLKADEVALPFEALNNFDWNRACLLAFRSKQAHVPKESYKEAFTEVMVLMRKCGMELEKGSLSTLLRFLVYSDHNPELLTKLLRRIYTDKSIPVSHLECIALTALLTKRRLSFNHRSFLAIAQPMYHSQNYLHIYPETLNKISDLVVQNVETLGGVGFLRAFEAAWASLQTPQGRRSLYDMMMLDVLEQQPSSSSSSTHVAHSRTHSIRSNLIRSRVRSSSSSSRSDDSDLSYDGFEFDGGDEYGGPSHPQQHGSSPSSSSRGRIGYTNAYAKNTSTTSRVRDGDGVGADLDVDADFEEEADALQRNARQGSAARDAVALISMYAAYLRGAHDGEYRQAFDLLFAVERLYQESEEYWLDREERIAMATAAASELSADTMQSSHHYLYRSNASNVGASTRTNFTTTTSSRARRTAEDILAERELY